MAALSHSTIVIVIEGGRQTTPVSRPSLRFPAYYVHSLEPSRSLARIGMAPPCFRGFQSGLHLSHLGSFCLIAQRRVRNRRPSFLAFRRFVCLWNFLVVFQCFLESAAEILSRLGTNDCCFFQHVSYTAVIEVVFDQSALGPAQAKFAGQLIHNISRIFIFRSQRKTTTTL